LESYIYKLKTIADSEEHNVYLSEEERSNYRAKSDEIDEFFMSEQLATSGLTDLQTRAKEIETFMHQFEYRKEEHRNRNGVYTRAIEALNKTNENIDTIQKLRTWIPVEKIDEAKETLEFIREEIVKAYEEQLATPLHVNPKFTYDFVSERMETLQKVITKLRAIEKPKKPVNATENLEDMIKNMGNFNFTDPNMNPEKIKELLENMKKYNITMDDMFKDEKGGDSLPEFGQDDKVETEQEVPEATEGDETRQYEENSNENDDVPKEEEQNDEQAKVNDDGTETPSSSDDNDVAQDL